MSAGAYLKWAGIAAATALLLGCSAQEAASPPPASTPSAAPESAVPDAQQQQPAQSGGTEDPGSNSSSGSSGASDAPGSGGQAADPEPGQGSEGGSSDPEPEPSSSGAPGSPAEPSSPPAADPEPAITITAMSCNGSGDHQTLRVQLTASYTNGYRKGITWVRMTRPDNRGSSWISQSDAVWAGQYAGKGDRWSGELPSRTPSKDNYGYDQDYGKTLKLRVRTDNGTIWEHLYPIERNC